MLLSPRKNGLDSLFKEVRVFKVAKNALVKPKGAQKQPTKIFVAQNSPFGFLTLKFPRKKIMWVPFGVFLTNFCAPFFKEIPFFFSAG